jgi:hypothetical protein
VAEEMVSAVLSTLHPSLACKETLSLETALNVGTVQLQLGSGPFAACATRAE